MPAEVMWTALKALTLVTSAKALRPCGAVCSPVLGNRMGEPLEASILLTRSFTFSECPWFVWLLSPIRAPLLSFQLPVEAGREDSSHSSTHGLV